MISAHLGRFFDGLLAWALKNLKSNVSVGKPNLRASLIQLARLVTQRHLGINHEHALGSVVVKRAFWLHQRA